MHTNPVGHQGMPVFDEFSAQLKELDNPQNLACLDSLMEKCPNKPDFDWPAFDSTPFQDNPKLLAAAVFDETIPLALSACKAARMAL